MQPRRAPRASRGVFSAQSAPTGSRKCVASDPLGDQRWGGGRAMRRPARSCSTRQLPRVGPETDSEAPIKPARPVPADRHSGPGPRRPCLPPAAAEEPPPSPEPQQTRPPPPPPACRAESRSPRWIRAAPRPRPRPPRRRRWRRRGSPTTPPPRPFRALRCRRCRRCCRYHHHRCCCCCCCQKSLALLPLPWRNSCRQLHPASPSRSRRGTLRSRTPQRCCRISRRRTGCMPSRPASPSISRRRMGHRRTCDDRCAIPRRFNIYIYF
jgi:hypothetical protein